MQNRLIKLLIAFTILIFTYSCTTTNIGSASKNVVYPGIATAKKYMNYEIIFNSNYSFSIEGIMLGDREIEKFYLQDIETQIFTDIKKNSFKAGNYKMGFKIYDKLKDNSSITINIKQKGKMKNITSTVIEKEAIRRR